MPVTRIRLRRSVLPVRLAIVIAALAAVALFASPGYAQQAGTGLRAGVSDTPDQFYFGVHFDTGALIDHLSFRPNAEIGVGDDRTSVSGNFEFAYWFPIPDHAWSVYVGGGPAINVYRYSDRLGGGTDVQPGFNAVGGIAHHRGLFAEVKLGFIHSPQFKFAVGYTWR